jgi:peptide/nickel transport system permease protein
MRCGIFAPVIAPYGEAEVISSAFAPPDENMLLGADQLGRDMFSRIIYGARNSVGLALAQQRAGVHHGCDAGLLAATKGGWFDQFMGRFADVIMSIPSLIFALSDAVDLRHQPALRLRCHGHRRLSLRSSMRREVSSA